MPTKVIPVSANVKSLLSCTDLIAHVAELKQQRQSEAALQLITSQPVAPIKLTLPYILSCSNPDLLTFFSTIGPTPADWDEILKRCSESLLPQLDKLAQLYPKSVPLSLSTFNAIEFFKHLPLATFKDLDWHNCPDSLAALHFSLRVYSIKKYRAKVDHLISFYPILQTIAAYCKDEEWSGSLEEFCYFSAHLSDRTLHKDLCYLHYGNQTDPSHRKTSFFSPTPQGPVYPLALNTRIRRTFFYLLKKFDPNVFPTLPDSNTIICRTSFTYCINSNIAIKAICNLNTTSSIPIALLVKRQASFIPLFIKKHQLSLLQSANLSLLSPDQIEQFFNLPLPTEKVSLPKTQTIRNLINYLPASPLFQKWISWAYIVGESNINDVTTCFQLITHPFTPTHIRIAALTEYLSRILDEPNKAPLTTPVFGTHNRTTAQSLTLYIKLNFPTEYRSFVKEVISNIRWKSLSKHIAAFLLTTGVHIPLRKFLLHRVTPAPIIRTRYTSLLTRNPARARKLAIYYAYYLGIDITTYFPDYSDPGLNAAINYTLVFETVSK